jgi:hypothetical protein
MYDLSNFTTVDAAKCGRQVRSLGSQALTMEEAANNVVRFFFDNFSERRSDAKACVLVRLFKTHSYSELGDDLKTFARNMHDGCEHMQDPKCFTLLATRGINPEWNLRRHSMGHQAIPLPSARVVESIPMMRNMIKQMGLEINSVINPDPAIVMDLSQRTYNVFCVPDAVGSPYVPAQEKFVKPFGVKSVLGVGGVLPSGNVFTLIIFARTSVSREVADRFTPLALNIKMAMLPFENLVFAGEVAGNEHVAKA